MRNERWRCDRSNGVVSHGLTYYDDYVLPSWYQSLEAAVVNAKTGMKQVGFKAHGDPCSCQVHRNGRVFVFPHAVGWENWLTEALERAGWDRGCCELLVNNLRLTVKVIEAGVKVPEGFLPKDLYLKTDWGLVVVRDDSPSKNTLELKLSVPDMKRYLGLTEFRKQLELLAQSGMATNQLVRVLATAIMALTRKSGSTDEPKGVFGYWNLRESDSEV